MIPQDLRSTIESLENVEGVGEGPDGQVIVFVTEKLPENVLSETDIIPKTVDIDGDSRETDVVESQGVWAHKRKTYRNPAPAGISCGHPNVTAGTWGTPPLLHSEHGEVILTNAHVAAPPGEHQVGDPILQPGEIDGGDRPAGDLIEGSEIRKSGNNYTDSAIFSAIRPTENRIEGIGTLDGFASVSFGESVRKSGRTTGVTESRLLAKNVSVNVRGFFKDDRARFVNVDAYTPMSSGGDSGSLVVAERENGTFGVGLLFAGSPQVTFVIPISNVFDYHGNMDVSESKEPDRPPWWQRWLSRLFGWR